MSLADALAAKKAKLKASAGPASAASETKQAELKQALLNEKKQADEMAAIHERIRAADLPSWYQALKEHTYETAFMPISLKEGQAMVAHYQQRTEAAAQGKSWTAPESVAAPIAALSARLEKVLGDFKEGAFVKLSSRSPKDATVASERTKQESKTKDDNSALVAISRAHILALRMTSAAEVMTVMLASERIYEDLKLATEYPDKWNQEFVLRRWVGIPIEYEFRGFVMNNELTALCQYYHFSYFPTLVENKDKILTMIRDFFAKVRDLVPLKPKEYVVDFAVDLEGNRVYIIELNPFGEYEGMGTSTAMFDKTSKADRDVLFGRSKFEFRYETKPCGDIFKHMADEWRTLMIAEGLHAPAAAASAGAGAGAAGAKA